MYMYNVFICDKPILDDNISREIYWWAHFWQKYVQEQFNPFFKQAQYLQLMGVYVVVQLDLPYLLPPVPTLQAGWLLQTPPTSLEQSSLWMPAAHSEAENGRG